MAGQLRILSGTTVVFDVSYAPDQLDELIMEDRSTIVLSGLDHWDPTINLLTVGSSCVIDGRGADGKVGHNETFEPGQAGHCENGEDFRARPGGDGGPGKNGTNISLTFGANLVAPGGLTIKVSGGKGGDGGSGGPGQKGGGSLLLRCDGKNGGRGGRGGGAGRGGDAGQVIIRFWPEPFTASGKTITDAEIETALAEGINCTSEGGGAGEPGGGGSPGAGGDGNSGRPAGGRGEFGYQGSKNGQGKSTLVDLKRIKKPK